MAEAKDWRFPTVCPACCANAGTPVRVARPGRRIEIWVRCDACAHEWMLDCDAPPLILTPRPTNLSG